MIEMFARLKRQAVTHATPVTDVTRYRANPLTLRELHALQVQAGKVGKRDSSPVTRPVPAALESDEVEILERAGLCADSVPAPYLDTWARLNCEKPMTVSEAKWRQALDDGGLFLDARGRYAAEWGWTTGDLFGVPRDGRQGGLLWRLQGALVKAFGPEHARLSDGRIIEREMNGCG